MANVPLLLFEQPPPPRIRARTSQILAALPPLDGEPIRIAFEPAITDRRRPADQIHAGSFIRERRIAFDRELVADPDEFGRVLVHELFHFAWVRAGNQKR